MASKKTNELRISPAALKDLEEIRDYIAGTLGNPAAAAKTLARITRDLRILERYGEAGPSVSALTGYSTELRLLVCGRYVALYLVKDAVVLVVRIIHAKQDYLRIILEEPPSEE